MATKKSNALKIFLIALPFIGGAVVVYLLYKAAQKNKMPASDLASDATAAQVLGSTASSGGSSACKYPLAKGSYDSSCVRSLQSALGVDVDGDWGPKTDAAFKAKTGKTSIANADELNSIIASLIAGAGASSEDVARNAKADAILNKWNSLTADTNWTVLNNTKWQQVNYQNGAYYSAGYTKQWGKNQKLSTVNYRLKNTTKKGYLIIEVSGGDGAFTGLWMADPTDLSLG